MGRSDRASKTRAKPLGNAWGGHGRHLAAVAWLCATAAGVAVPSARAGPGAGTELAPQPAWWRTAGATGRDLRTWRQQLEHTDAATRSTAVRALSSLTPDSLGAIEQRLSERARHPIDADQVRRALSGLRHRVGSRRADDMVDIRPAIPPALAAQPDATMLTVVETVLLTRSLETMQTVAAGRLLARVLELDGGAYRWEVWRVRKRAGLWLLPSLIELRSHDSRRVKRWAAAGVRELGMTDPQQALSVGDPHLAAQVVRAYATPLDFEAMPALVRLVRAESVQVREAARWAVARFGKNAVWQLRELYEEVTGGLPDRRLGHAETARELYAVIDSARTERANAHVTRGLAALDRGQLERMGSEFDLARSVHGARLSEPARMAEGYAALGASRLRTAGQAAHAAAAYRSALALAGDEDRTQLQAHLLFSEAEASVQAGIPDLSGFERALQLDPTLVAAQERLDELTGVSATRAARRKRLAAGAAAVLLLALLALVLRPADRSHETGVAPEAG